MVLVTLTLLVSEALFLYRIEYKRNQCVNLNVSIMDLTEWGCIQTIGL